MTTPAQGYQMIAELIRAGKEDAATALTEALQWRAENEPRLKAFEFEMKFLLDQIRSGYGVGACRWTTVEEMREQGDADATSDALLRVRQPELITHFVVTTSFDQGERHYAVVTPSPRLTELLNGEVPALRDFERAAR